MNYYWMYYFLPVLIGYAMRNPWACAVALAFLAVRRWLPDPVVLVRTLGRLGPLKAQTSANASNFTARRDLGRAYIDLLRPRAALRYLDEARELDPGDRDVAYLRGQALLRLHEDEAALEAFGEAAGVDGDGHEGPSRNGGRRGLSRHRDGEAYLGAAIALERLGRLPQAEEALTVSASHNSSSLEPILRLSRVRRRMGNHEGARAALDQARATWSQLPPFMRRRQLGAGLRMWRAVVIGR